ncbi:kelch repeat-containing protein [Persicimonas caeni]|nr:kelch repeat-containing protein [Persicimonas caeni]
MAVLLTCFACSDSSSGSSDGGSSDHRNRDDGFPSDQKCVATQGVTDTGDAGLDASAEVPVRIQPFMWDGSDWATNHEFSSAKLYLNCGTTGEQIEEHELDSSSGSTWTVSSPVGSHFRVVVELYSSDSTLLARGATGFFDVAETDEQVDLGVQLGQPGAFAPVGSVVRRNGQAELTQSRMDYRAIREIDSDRWLGRVGHRAVPVNWGDKLLIVGGADLAADLSPATLPRLTVAHDDLMEFDPNTGYFTDLSFDEAAGRIRADGADRLRTGRAFHTATPLGPDRFLIVGGLTVESAEPYAVDSIELIDLGEPPGSRVRLLKDSSGAKASLLTARAFHTATYRSADNSVVIAGGISTDGDVLNSVEIVNLDDGTVSEGTPMNSARTDHQAVLMADGKTVWVLGGRDDSNVLASTEFLELSDGATAPSAGPVMQTPRFEFAALRVSPGESDSVLVVGGYTDVEGDVTDTFEFSNDRGAEFVSRDSWRLEAPRGGLVAVEVPQSHDVVVLGGRDAAGDRVGDGEILNFGSLNDPNPYVATTTSNSTVNQRSDFTASLLLNGKVVLVGGIGTWSGTTTALDNAEYFTPK